MVDLLYSTPLTFASIIYSAYNDNNFYEKKNVLYNKTSHMYTSIYRNLFYFVKFKRAKQTNIINGKQVIHFKIYNTHKTVVATTMTVATKSKTQIVAQSELVCLLGIPKKITNKFVYNFKVIIFIFCK